MLLLMPVYADGYDGSGSGVSDIYEAIYGRALPADGDADNDGYTNYIEYLLGTDPLDPTSPGDFGLTVNATTARIWIPNQTGLRFKLQMTADLTNWDAGGEWEIADGFRTYAEIDIDGLSRLFFRIEPAPPLDSDDDGLNDWEEAILGTKSLLVDSDGDGFTDVDEFAEGSDPTAPDSVPSVILEKAAHLIQVYNSAPPSALIGHAWSSVTSVQNNTASLNLGSPVWSPPVVVHNSAMPLELLPELWSPPVLVYNQGD